MDRTGAWWEKLSVSYRAEELQETVLPILKLVTAPQPLRGLPAECLGQK